MDRELLISQGTLRLKKLPIEYPTTRQDQLVSGRTIGETRLIVHSRVGSKLWNPKGLKIFQNSGKLTGPWLIKAIKCEKIS